MKIAMLAPLIERIPPKRYGGTERFISYLTDELVKRGHEVYLFATGDSITKAKLISTTNHPLREMYVSDTTVFTIINVTKVYKNSNQFDIIHNNADYLAFPMAHFVSTPTVTTLHGPVNLENKNIYEVYRDLNFVSISKSQRKLGQNLNWLTTIHHGIPISSFPFKSKPKDYLLIVGRISPEKGTHIAMDIAMALNKELIIAAKLDKNDVDYFNQYVAPRLSNGKIRWVGEVDDKERNKLMSEALCMLHPVTWPEPFGFVLVEAMATGCPVIAFNKGSIPEIVINKKTGFVVEKEKEMIQAIKKISSISRRACRNHVKENFNLKKMVDSYEKLYYRIVYERTTPAPTKRDKRSKEKVLV